MTETLDEGRPTDLTAVALACTLKRSFASSTTVQLASIQLGGLMRTDLEVITRDYASRSAADAKFSGILGREFFADGLLVIDFPRKLLSFSRTSTLASVRPVNIMAIAAAVLPGSARRLATTAPTPKKAPCGKPARKRDAIIVSKFGANADIALNTANISMNQISTVRGGRPATIVTRVGAPTTTPSA